MTTHVIPTRAGQLPRRTLLLALALLLAGACSDRTGGELLVTLAVDGGERSILLEEPLTVTALLERTGIERGPLDRIEPAPDSMVRDGMRVTIVRVMETQECERVEIPFAVVGDAQDLAGSLQTRRTRTGISGEEQRCFRVRLENGVPRHREELSRVVIREPVDEIWQAGPPSGPRPLRVQGTLVWLSEGNAWMARGDSSRVSQVTRSGALDGQVLTLSDDGNSLLFTRMPGPGEARTGQNQLWLAADLNDPGRATRLLPEDVTAAGWLPGSSLEFGYASAALSNTFARVRVDPRSGETIAYREFVAPVRGRAVTESAARFAWSPDGRQLAWAYAGDAGLLGTEGGSGRILASSDHGLYQPFRCRFPSLAWSADGAFLFAVLPAATEGGSDVIALDVTGEYAIPLLEGAGPCPAPGLAAGQLVYLRARDPDRPLSRAGHDLMAMDRDGSNPRLLFPASGQPGLQPQRVAWSPDARQLAFIHGERLWLYDFDDDEAREFPFPGDASLPDWAG